MTKDQIKRNLILEMMSEYESGGNNLNERQRRFVNGFHCGVRSVFDNQYFILFGKGLQV